MRIALRNAIAWWLVSSLCVRLRLASEAGAAGDITQKFGTPTAITITLGSLASSSSHTVGRESTAIVAAEPEIDHLVSGKVKTGTSPTAGTTIRVWAYAQHDDTPTYPDVFDGTDSGETVTSENVRNAALAEAALVVVDSTSDQTYWIRPFSIATLFGRMPKRYGLFVAQNTTVNLNASGHEFKYTPIYENVAQS